MVVTSIAAGSVDRTQVSERAFMKPPSPGAPSIEATTHAITLRGATYNWAILAGHKNIENRSTRISPGWYFLHTGARNNSAEAQASIRARVPEDVRVPVEDSLPHAVIVGFIKISHSLPLEQCAGSPWATGPVCNVIEAVCELGTPISQKGNLGQWPVGPDVAGRASIGLMGAQIRLLDNSALPPVPDPTIAFPHRKRKASSTASKHIGTEKKEAYASASTALFPPIDVGHHDDIMERRTARVARAARCSTKIAKDALTANGMNMSQALSAVRSATARATQPASQSASQPASQYSDIQTTVSHSVPHAASFHSQ